MEKTKNQPFAEIIESDCSKFLAQTWDPEIKPNLGRLVETETNNITIFGIISNIQTGSQDPLRYPFTYKKTEEELKKEQPQIFEFLKTTFDAQIVGYKLNEKINYSLPSKPANIHSFVKTAQEQTISQFLNSTDFLSLMFNSQIPNLDEVLISVINNFKNLNKNFLYKFTQNFSLLSGNDYKRLKLFLKRIEFKNI